MADASMIMLPYFAGFGLVIGVVAYWFWLNKIIPIRFPALVIIHQRRGEGGIQIKMDRAVRLRDKLTGDEVYRLRKEKKDVKPPDYKYLYIQSNGAPVLELFSPQFGQYNPIEIQNPTGLKVLDKGTVSWLIHRIAKIQQKYPEKKGIWEKYSALISIMVVVMVVIIVSVMFLWKSSEIMAALSGNFHVQVDCTQNPSNTSIPTTPANPNPIPTITPPI